MNKSRWIITIIVVALVSGFIGCGIAYLTTATKLWQELTYGGSVYAPKKLPESSAP